ncbi:hypothetical protein [Parathalassolituus penaei]|uniref:Uncharacterized protein n=1 Tax=Parathalassolituus penaei TaxID=2997323 RepID=A0A9X3ISI9_9GAMM|nr:hypothetical protein [Parathalassolituus penaei]MCY0965886.1 hypothetical protein [Parathalassolituus penaei]
MSYSKKANLFTRFLLLLIGVLLAKSASANLELADPKWIVSQYASTPLIAIGDVHGSDLPLRYVMNALTDDAVFNSTNDIVVEWGNARFQALADRYLLDGEDIPINELRSIWRDTLFFMAWQYQVYEDFLVNLHELNQRGDHKIRLVLAEPAFDWVLLDHAEWQTLVDSREQHYADVIQQQVLAQHRQGLLLFGTFHNLRVPVTLVGDSQPTCMLVCLLEQQQTQSSVFSVFTHMNGKPLGSTPGLIDLQSNALGQKTLAEVTGGRTAAGESSQMNRVADAYLYLGPDPRNATISKAVTEDRDWQQEVMRRAQIVGGRVLEQARLWQQSLSASR